MKLQHKTLPASLWLFLTGVAIFSGSSQAQNAENIVFTPDRAMTIPGHGMSKGEYPYDEAGTYQTDWVSPSAKSSVKSSVTVKDPIPKDSKDHPEYARRIAKKAEEKLAKIEIKPEPKKAPAPVVAPKPEPTVQTVAFHPPSKPADPPRQISESEALSLGFIGPYAKMIGLKQNIVAHVPGIGEPEIENMDPIYHRVVSGDTLFNISRKYGTTVETLKKVNGLTSDLIKVGQSLRLTIAQQALRLPKG